MIRLQTLGRPTVLLPDGTEAVHVVRQQKRLALLVYLAAFRERESHTFTHLAGVFWPGIDPRRARNSLRQALHYLRRHLGGAVLIRNSDRSLSVSRDCLTTDARQFRAAITDERWEDALELYGGDFMSGLALESMGPFGHWAEEERTVLRQAAAGCARRLGDQSESSGDLRAATHRWRQATTLWPAHEPTIQRLVSSLIELGDRMGAIRALESFERQVRSTLGRDVSAETRSRLQHLLGTAEPPDTERAGLDVPPGGVAGAGS